MYLFSHCYCLNWFPTVHVFIRAKCCNGLCDLRVCFNKPGIIWKALPESHCYPPRSSVPQFGAVVAASPRSIDQSIDYLIVCLSCHWFVASFRFRCLLLCLKFLGWHVYCLEVSWKDFIAIVTSTCSRRTTELSESNMSSDRTPTVHGFTWSNL